MSTGNRIRPEGNGYYCPYCSAVLGEQLGFDPNRSTWACEACDQLLCGEHIYSGEKYPDVMWYCDGCGALLNEQPDFSDLNEAWQCRKCGHENHINDDEIYESDEIYISNYSTQKSNRSENSENESDQGAESGGVSVRLSLEYGAWPVWIIEGGGVDPYLPEDWEDTEELENLLDDIQNRLNRLYIDEPHAFEYVGFETQADKEEFAQLCVKAAEMVYRINAGKYPIENHIPYELEDYSIKRCDDIG